MEPGIIILADLIFFFTLVISILVILLVFLWQRTKFRKNTNKDIRQLSSMFGQWVDGLANVSGIPKDQLMDMPLSEVEKLRAKYNYK